MKELKIRPLTEEERKYTYAQSAQLDGQTGNIGYLRGILAVPERNFLPHGRTGGGDTKRTCSRRNWMRW